jgi:hypothetical protein
MCYAWAGALKNDPEVLNNYKKKMLTTLVSMDNYCNSILFPGNEFTFIDETKC